MLTLHRNVSPTETGDEDWLGPAPWIVTPLPGPIATAALGTDIRGLQSRQSTACPLVARRARGSVIEDVDGNRFLDFAAGVTGVVTGHCHPSIVRAIHDQSMRLTQTCLRTIFCQRTAELADALLRAVGCPGLQRVVFSNGGTQALRRAAQFARRATGRSHILHVVVPSEAAARRENDSGYVTIEAGTAEQIVECLGDDAKIKPDAVAAVILEPPLPDERHTTTNGSLLADVRQLCDRHGWMLLFDETRTGMGRTGQLLSFQVSNVVPDAVCLGRALASGLPIGAVIGSDALVPANDDLDCQDSCAGPISCAAGVATLEVLQGGLIGNAAKLALHASEKLRPMAARWRSIGSLRGRGLLHRLTIVRNRRSHTPYPEMRDRIVSEAYDTGLFLLGVGQADIAICPPLCMNQVQLDVGLDVLAESIATVHD